jgi:hypothetical protein
VHCERYTSSLLHDWEKYVAEPARRNSSTEPRLKVITSPYTFVIGPLVDYVLQLEANHPDRMIAVLLPELVERHWLHYLLHNHRPEVLAFRLMLRGNERIMIVNVPWHLPG